MKCNESQPHQFVLEGRFAGFADRKKKPFKYLRLNTAEGEFCIKLPRYLQVEVVSHFTPGDWIQVMGTRKAKSDGALQLKAELLFPANPGAPLPALSTPLSVSLPENCPLQHEDAAEAPPCQDPVKILVCRKSGCMKRGGKDVCQRLETVLQDEGLSDRVTVKMTGCMDRCKAGPNLVFMPDKARYSKVEPEEIPELIQRHIQ